MESRILAALFALLATLACGPPSVVSGDGKPTPGTALASGVVVADGEPSKKSVSFWHRGEQTCSVMFFRLEETNGNRDGVMQYTLAISAPQVRLEGSMAGTLGAMSHGAVGMGNGSCHVTVAPMAGFTWGQVMLVDQLDVKGIEAWF